ncbi:MAG TPA: NAD(P)H-binding protein [Segetibacter sp.]
MQSSTAVVLGATGLIGEQLVQQLLNDPAFSKVRILVRRPVQLSHSKLEVAIVDFNKLSDYESKLGKGDFIFCCIGTTQKQVKGDKALYRKIDFDIPVNAAKLGIKAGFTKYFLVSAVGANAASQNFYLKLKGEVEAAITDIGFSALHVFRPSILLGKRKELRVAELFGKGVMQAISVFFAGALKKYKGIKGEDVAKAMIAAAKSDTKGLTMYEYEEMVKIIS